MVLLQQVVPCLPDYHLVSASGVIEAVDLLCNHLRHTVAKKIRGDLRGLQRVIDINKSGTVDTLMEQVASQRLLLDQQQQTIDEQRALIEQQNTLIRSLQLQSLVTPSAPCAGRSDLSLHHADLLSGNPVVGLKTGICARTPQGKSCGGRLCPGCGLVVPKKCFSANQLTKLVNAGTGRCRACVERGVVPSAAIASVSSPFHPAISPLPRALTLAVRDQPCLSPSENLLTPQLPPVPASCFPLSSPEHSYTSLQTNLSCARGGVSTEEPKAGDADADTVGN